MKPFSQGFNNSIFASDKLGYSLLLINIVFLYLRPQEIFFILKPLRLPGILSMLMLVWFVVHIKSYVFKDIFVRRILVLIFVFLLCSIGSVNVIGYRRVILWSTSYFPLIGSMYLLVCTPERVEHFFKFLSIIFFSTALITIRNNGYGPGDFIYDENEVALFLTMGLPLVYYFSQWHGLSKFFRYFSYLTLVILLISIVITQSRGGLVGLIMIIFIMWLFTKNKVKIAAVTILFTSLSGGVILSQLPDGYVQDVTSGFQDSEDSTRKERFRSWEAAWLIFSDNIFLGVGVGNFPYKVGSYEVKTSWWYDGAKSLQGRQVHSMLFEVLSDTGLLGFIVYFSTVYLVFIKSLQVQEYLSIKNIELNYELLSISLLFRGLLVAIVGFIGSGMFISVAYYPHLPFLLGLASILFRYKVNARESAL